MNDWGKLRMEEMDMGGSRNRRAALAPTHRCKCYSPAVPPALFSLVCAFLSGFTSAKPPVLDPPLGCEDTQTLTALVFFPVVQSSASPRGEDSFGHRCSLRSKASLQCAAFVAAVKAKAQSFVIFEI